MEPAEDLFEGPAVGLPEPIPSRSALYVPETEASRPVRHVRGYAPFLAFCAAQGVSARELAADPVQLIAFLRASAPDILSELRLRDAAGVFTGNAIAALRPDARWQTSGDSPPTVDAWGGGFTPGILPARLGEAGDDAVQGFLAWLRDWEQGEEDLPALEPRPVPLPVDRPGYVRPDLPRTECRDEGGNLVPYGSRWGGGGPPEETYSVDSHPERFAGLHAVARALIDHLVRTYDAEAADATAGAAAELRGRIEVIEAVRVAPRATDAAPLTFVFTAYPGVLIQAGLLHDFPFPACGCDACDETAESAADQLERLVFAVAAGGYAERYPAGRRRWAEYALTAVDGSGAESGSGGPSPNLGPDRLRDAEVRLQEFGGRWQPWPLRPIGRTS
ncbi:DUF6226 family protein [Arthrobacter sp. I2-34]|uniref:DUF6226 family protein n=1 Tax=Arthrobacter hankyongi TaxID=2904801 RepID=A0ABS9L4S6_9MICC|nr:DUF6226 family protein [Arthrobacter hankyongi]MCG2621687.1 DUF6226 family protein [Arthrobacter hankyongi]